MSNQGQSPEFFSDDNVPAREITLEPRIVKITARSGVDIRRTLPHRQIRTIGAWCFVDHYGPTEQREAMRVSAHPHAGLQTISWLFSGEVEHRDSLGNIKNVVPGELNLMTSGRGIAHSELSIDQKSPLHGVQLWTVLPESDRNMEPTFEHHRDLPIIKQGRASVRLVIGDFLGQKSLAKVFTPLLAAEIDIPSRESTLLPINPDYEYGVLVVSGELTVNGSDVHLGQLHYLPAGASALTLVATDRATVLLIGGQPFREKIIMWWNFIARSHDEIVKMRDEWQSQSPGITAFADGIGGRIPAPHLPNVRLSPRGNLS